MDERGSPPAPPRRRGYNRGAFLDHAPSCVVNGITSRVEKRGCPARSGSPTTTAGRTPSCSCPAGAWVGSVIRRISPKLTRSATTLFLDRQTQRQRRNAPDGPLEGLMDPSHKGGVDYLYPRQTMTGFLSRLQEKPLGRAPVFSRAGPPELPSTVPV
jgi:hypothetical protein